MKNYLGKFKDIYILKSTNERYLMYSSSGAVGITVLDHLLDKYIINCALVVTFDKNDVVRPILNLAYSKKQISESGGPKYLYFSPESVIKKIEETKGNIGVVALPCTCVKIRQLKEKSLLNNVKFIIGLFCGWNMDYNATEYLIKKTGIPKESVAKIDYRGGPYPGGFCVEDKKGRKKIFDKAFYEPVNMMFLRKDCLECRLYMGEGSDIAIGDAWIKRNPKNTAVLTRTEEGDALIKELINEKKLEGKTSTPEDLIRMHQLNLKFKKSLTSKAKKVLIWIFQNKIFIKIAPFYLLGFLSKIRRKLFVGIDSRNYFIQNFVKEIRYLCRKKWSLKDIGEFWDSISDYDEINTRTHSYRRRFEDGFDLVDIKKADRLLDICCRTGNGSLYFSEHAAIKNSICVDISKNFLKICKERLNINGVNADFVRISSLPLPFDNGIFDTIICFETVEHIYEVSFFIDELCRVLKRGGTLLITSPNKLWAPVHFLAAIFNIHHSEGPRRFLSAKKIMDAAIRNNLRVISFNTKVLIPAGPQWLLRFGKKLEKLVGPKIMHILGLRNIFVCKK